MAVAPPATELESALRELRATRAATLGLVADVDALRAEWSPGAGQWSVAQVLDHLGKAEAYYRRQLETLFERRRAGQPATLEVGLREFNARPVGLPSAVLPLVEAPLRLAGRLVPAEVREQLIGTPVVPFVAPDVAAPDAVPPPIEWLRERLAASLAETESLLAGRDVTGMAFDHPLLGRNDVPALLRLLARHEERHHRQISRVLAASPRTAHRRTTVSAPAATGAEANEPAASAHVQALAEDAESSLVAARQMVAWWRDKTLRGELHLFPLRPPHPPHFEMEGFFDEIRFLGQMKPLSIMGCLQRHRFRRRRPPREGLTRHLESFVDQFFLDKCFHVRSGGAGGGFRYRELCFRDAGGRLREVPDRDVLGAAVEPIAREVEWRVHRVDILDFVRANPLLARFDDTLSRFVRQSAYIVFHKDLAAEVEPRPAGVIAERRLGYAFLQQSVEPTYFGFGPGRFGAAVKQWCFRLFSDGDVEIRIAFLVSPRSAKVLDLGGFDPVYATVAAADVLTLGALGLRSRAQDALDTVFLRHHGDVHAGVVNDMREIWESQRWMPAFDSW